jgi:hypothetical protein
MPEGTRKGMQPRYVADLFAPLHAELMALLRRLTPEEWQRQTVAPQWRVRDVAAHLLDGQLRKLSAQRDGHLLPLTGTVLEIINGLNASGVAYAARLSPRLLTDLLSVVGPWMAELVESLDPHAPAIFPVAWAGEAQSENWMDTGREYTEWWHHQMQIRDAVGSGALLLERRWLEPLLDFSLRALPHAYAGVSAEEGSAIEIAIGEDAWSLRRMGGGWQVGAGATPDAAASIRLEPDAAWRLFYNALPADQARNRITVRGEERLIAPLLSTRSVMV